MPQVIASRRAVWRRGVHVNKGRHDLGVDFLSKLYDRERLAMAVRRVLDRPAKNSEDPQGTGAGGPFERHPR